MNILFLILIHASVFLLLMLPGLLETIEPLLTSFEAKTVSGLPEGFALHPMVILPILQYIGIGVLATIALSWSHLKITIKLFGNHFESRQLFLLNVLWGLGLWLGVVALNSAFFPHSKFSNPDFLWISQQPAVISAITLVITLPVLTLAALKMCKYPKAMAFGVISTSIWLFSARAFPLFSDSSSSITKQPNVFIIGIDSLRPELINAYMPFLSEQLEKSKQFPNSYTPFARTYPSWMSIITGRYPHSNGARFNLSDDALLSSDNIYLPEELKRIGYQTIYASDERRFSNLGRSHGFDRVVGPETGIRDFILGTFADFPINNLLLKTPMGKALFPEIYGNRAAHRLYYPEHFSKELEKAIDDLNNSPVFLATHFCLPHWPYTFANHLSSATYSPSPLYPANLQAVDEQIFRLFEKLSEKKLLENSIVLFLSDHGESWGLVNTGLRNQEDKMLEVTDFGHGMNIMSEDSHKVLLALNSDGINNVKDQSLRSLVDIAPTIYELLNIKGNTLVEGYSLTSPSPKHRSTFFESGIVMAEANQENPSAKAVAAAGLRHFQINDAGMLRIKPDSVIEMLSQKQVGVRDSQKGIYYGRYTSDSPEILIADYINKTFTTYDVDANFSSGQLFLEFCDAYKNVNQDTERVCLDDHLKH